MAMRLGDAELIERERRQEDPKCRGEASDAAARGAVAQQPLRLQPRQRRRETCPQRPARRSACGDRTGGASGADGVEHARLARVLGTAGARQRPQHSVGGHLDEPGALQRIDRQPHDAAVAVAQESDGVGVRPLRDRGKRPGFVRRSGAREDQGKHGGDGDEREKDQEIRPRHVGEGIVGQRVHRSVPLGRGGDSGRPTLYRQNDFRSNAAA